ncbi:MAG: polysaccharide deacetylase family protein [Azoarcus sp.]|jgi:peptidoglycan/xylan/chitin deacetylase (PgdA/CDA1 family)|nr:polysaccharide deacetylase family protein [Azoarcus sp.]
MKPAKLFGFCVLSAVALWAYGASADMTVARIDRNAYAPITDQASFDRASRQAILAFAKELSVYEREPGAARNTATGSTGALIHRFWNDLLLNYKYALKTCSDCESVSTITDLRNLADKSQSDSMMSVFYKTYLLEQTRLASLFPRISSEIDVFNDNEITGSSFNDMEFLLSFDDGPTEKNGSTDRLIESLNRLNVHAVFFALGERLNARQKSTGDLANVYINQCLASHGQTHQSHAKLADWQTSVLGSLATAKTSAPAAFVNAFRPPYGQRKADSGNFFKQHNIKVVLWDIDSQDWQKQISAQNAADRIISLMLLRRKGIILFHDIHPKAFTAISEIVLTLKNTDIKWLDCKGIADS